MPYRLGQDLPMDGPYAGLKTVTPSDSADLPNGIANAIYCAVGGNLKIDTPQGDTQTIAITAGWANLTKVLVRRVYATGTTATGIIACYT